MAKGIFLILAACAMLAQAAVQQDAAQMAANPIRKVVTMLQAMEKKVAAEGEKEKELYDKFMCYCNSGGGALSKSIADAGTKIPQVGADIEAGEAKHAQLQEDLKKHRSDRDAANAAMASATTVREKEAADFATEKTEAETNIAALAKATAAVEKGVAGGFLQTGAAQVLRNIVNNFNQDMAEGDRQELAAFLSNDQSSDYSPQSGEITGILKQLGDEMKKGLNDATAVETSAIASFDALMAAKKKEVAACTAAIEEKTVRVGELAVDIVQMKEDLSDTEEALLDDKKFLANLETSCKTKTAEMEERVKTRSQELLALADTIKILNDDDALELFKKTLPGASASFVQMQQNSDAIRARALAQLRTLAATMKQPRLDFIALALRGKKIGFDKVIKMIDNMVALLKTEQQDDDYKKEDCDKQLDFADDKKKGLERSLADLETGIADLDESIATTASEIKALQDSTAALDKSVAEATEQRKDENAEYTELMASNSAAKELLLIAKNRMQKFYNPSLYKAPPKRVLSEEERLYVASGGTLDPTEAPGGIAGTGVTVLAQIRAHSHTKKDTKKADPGPAPETFSGDYQKKSGESTGVLAMMDLLVKDLDKEMQVAETEEKDAQGDYEKAMADAKDKRAADAKLLTEKASAKAEMGADLEAKKEAKVSTGKELDATHEYIKSLHNDCDFLLKYFDVRKEARASEVDALGKAKAVLSGADFSLLQVPQKITLRRA